MRRRLSIALAALGSSHSIELRHPELWARNGQSLFALTQFPPPFRALGWLDRVSGYHPLLRFLENLPSPFDDQSTNADPMTCDYDRLYGEARDALGNPTSVFVDFFDRLDQPNIRVLDVGCGQGRDAIFIARKGHHVVGVDLSANGIRDLNDAAAQENLPIEGVVADIAS